MWTARERQRRTAGRGAIALAEGRREDRRLRAADPARQADRYAAALVADIERALAGVIRNTVVGSGRNFRTWHAAHALGGLRGKRLRRPRIRRARGTHRQASAGIARNRAVGGAGGGPRAGGFCIAADSATQSGDAFAVGAGIGRPHL